MVNVTHYSLSRPHTHVGCGKGGRVRHRDARQNDLTFFPRVEITPLNLHAIAPLWPGPRPLRRCTALRAKQSHRPSSLRLPRPRRRAVRGGPPYNSKRRGRSNPHLTRLPSSPSLVLIRNRLLTRDVLAACTLRAPFRTLVPISFALDALPHTPRLVRCWDVFQLVLLWGRIAVRSPKRAHYCIRWRTRRCLDRRWQTIARVRVYG